MKVKAKPLIYTGFPKVDTLLRMELDLKSRGGHLNGTIRYGVPTKIGPISLD